ncbi:MAG: methylamine utilization protein [Gammaproteobacteria bacterium]|nr:methylamine utilization protein [Gammaproteobacteria bacterium]
MHALPMIILSVLVAAAAPARAASIAAQVVDESGSPLAFAVVHVAPLAGQVLPAPAEAVVDQQDREFLPYVTAIQAGSAISFPNNDAIRHQVYSFSPAKSFELPLYKGNPHRPVAFEQPGVVALGCNIHDWMNAFVFVSATPWFAVTDASGKARLEGLPAGDYRIQVWHPKQQGEPAETAQALSLTAEGQGELRFAVSRKSLLRPWRAPTALKTAGY